MEVLNAMQLKKGAKSKQSSMGVITQPIQFLPRDQKDEDWVAWNCDWIEWEGIKQMRRKVPRLSKNFKLAKGIIDRSDYIPTQEAENKDLFDVLTWQGDTALDLKFFPIIPNVVNTLCNEFSKRITKCTYRAVDEFSYNEMLEAKRQQVENVLLAQAKQQMLAKLISQGIDTDDPKVQEDIGQQTSIDNLKTLPEIEGFFTKNYRSMIEEWATHQHNVDTDRFNMDELEERNFRNMLITDSEFWHFRMGEDDYEVETWNPLLTFYHKSPENRYISQGLWVGKVDMLTIADVIDRYGYLMNEEQLESLYVKFPTQGAAYPLQGYQNDGNYYDSTKSHAWNTDAPGLAMRQFTSMYNGSNDGLDIVDWITRQTEDYRGLGSDNFLRVSTIYWKSQRKVGHLTKIKDTGEVLTDIVDEAYKISDAAVYNNTLIRNRTKDTLIFGEHIDWIWINEVWGAVKIGPNYPTYWNMGADTNLQPMYIGIDQNKPAPLKFQFKGDNNLYGCKLPVEGAIFSDYNTKSMSLVDLMKPHQISYNIVNNQISDILADELGTVVLLDQNALPKHSLGEDWGKGNYAKAYVAMKNFQVLPFDTSLTNTENAINFQHFQKLDLEQSNRLMSRVNLANYFKQQAYEVVGLNPQRMGQQLGRQTATGVEENLNASYAQTETYFTQHCDYLMPRVHQMRTDLAQFYNSTKASTRLQYVTSTEDSVNFQINGTDLLARDLNIYATTKASIRNVVEQLKRLALNNNTTGATIYDLGNVMMADSIGEVSSVLKGIEEKNNAARQQQQQQEMQRIEMEKQAALQERQLVIDAQAMENEKNRRKDILVAEIRSAGFGAMQDINKNETSDYVDFLKETRASTEYNQTMGFEAQKEANRANINVQKNQTEREKLNAQLQMKLMDLEIARENKTKYEIANKKANKGKK